MSEREKKQVLKRLTRFLNDECTGEEAIKMEKWLLMNIDSPEADDIFEKVLADVRVVGDPAAKDRARRRLNRFIEQNNVPAHRVRNRLWYYFLTALQVMFIALLSGVALWQYNKMGDTQSWVEEYAPYGETKQVTLPDGSQMWLRADSRIIYPERFGNKVRRIYASGEIYADVVTDHKRPFIVESNEAVVKVLGTKFNFKSYREAYNIELSLLEGSVSLGVTAAEIGQQEYLLQPGNTIRVDKRSGRSERYDFDPGEYVSWKDRRILSFVNQPLSDIVAELERSFDVRIVIDDERLKSVRYLASFINGEPLEQILSFLNADNKMHITYHNDMIIISGK